MAVMMANWGKRENEGGFRIKKEMVMMMRRVKRWGERGSKVVAG